MPGYFLLYPHKIPYHLLSRVKCRQNLEDSFGLELATDVVASEAIPPYDVSLRDGWALCSTDEVIRQEQGPIDNGRAAERLERESCRRINTGGYLPIRADAVLATDHSERPSSGTEVYSGENVLPAGSEWRKGELLLKVGTVIGASETALLTEAGVSSIEVYRRPVVAILATGHELKEAGSGESGCRHASNAIYLLNLLSALGLTDSCIFYCLDDVRQIADRLSVLQESFDLIVCVGGTGQGRSDRLRGALRSVGAQSIDSGTKLSSSLPYLCASLGTTLILGLPGNSLGFINIAQRVVIPLVWNAFRTRAFEFCRVSVVLGFEAEAKEGTICVRLANHGSQLIALPMQKGTGRASVFRDAAAVVDNPRGTLIPAGTVVTAEKFFNGIIGYK